jgi:hypothetical protein
MIKTNHLRLTDIIAVYYEAYKRQINLVCKENTEFLGKMLSFVIVTVFTKYITITKI